MTTDEPSAGGAGWGIRPGWDAVAPSEPPAAAPAGDDLPPPPPPWAPPPWAPPPPPRSAGLSALTLLPVLLLAGGALAAVLLVRHDGGSGGLTAPDVIEGEHRLTGGDFAGIVSAEQDLLRKADPQVQSVVFDVYGNGSIPDHMVFAEKGVAQDPTMGLQAFSGANFPSFAGASLGVGAPTVVTSDRESFTCFAAAMQGLPQSDAMTLCFWSDPHPADAGGVMCLGSADLRSCADYAAVARKGLLGG